MLHTISWQQYSTAVILLTAAWYACVGLKYFQPELHSLLRIKVASPMPPVAALPMRAVMGSIQSDTQSTNAEELVFSHANPDDISDATLPKGPSDDLLAEAIILAGASGTKAGFLPLLQVLLDKYGIYRDEISLPAFTTQLLALQLPFELSAHELDLHWSAENYA
jgi:hypothetical protein